MIYPDRREGNLPIIVDLFPLTEKSCKAAIRDILDRGMTIGEDGLFCLENELLQGFVRRTGENIFGSENTLFSDYQRGALLLHRALRSEALSQGGELTPFDHDLLLRYRDSYVDVNAAHYIDRFMRYYTQSGVTLEEALPILLERNPDTVRRFNNSLIRHYDNSRKAFEENEGNFYNLTLQRIAGEPLSCREATFIGASQVWSAFKFLGQKPSA